MSTKLRDFIQSIRNCQTISDERAIIYQECALIRTAFKEDKNHYRARCVAKLLYISMLGYPTYFGQMECVKLIASSNFAEKRIGYLGLCQLLDEDSEVLMLVTNSIKKDLLSSSQFVNSLALTALASMATPEMCRSLSREIRDMMNTSNPYIKKKATICAIKVARKVGGLDELATSSIASLIQYRNHGVALSGCVALSSYLQTCKKKSAVAEEFLPVLTNALANTLNLKEIQDGVSDHGTSQDLFLQCKILHLLRTVGTGTAKTADRVADILAQIATNTTMKGNVANSVLYECVRTILSIDCEEGLRVLATNTLGRFLESRDNDTRYVALCLLQHVVKMDMKTVQRHQSLIMSCLKEPDLAIRRSALDLTYLLINEENIKAMTKELLNSLLDADSAFKGDLVLKIFMAVDRYSPTKKWHIDTLIKVMCLAGNYVQDEERNSFVNLILTNSSLHSFAVRRLFFSLRENINEESLVQVATWCLGEYGHLLVAPRGDEDDDLSCIPTASEILDTLEEVYKRPKPFAAGNFTAEFLLSALAKLSVRLPEEISRISNMIKKYENDISIELQQRSCEFQALLGSFWEKDRAMLFERIPCTPAIQMRCESRLRGFPAGGKSSAAEGQRMSNNETKILPATKNTLMDLFDFDADAGKQQASGSPIDDVMNRRGENSAATLGGGEISSTSSQSRQNPLSAKHGGQATEKEILADLLDGIGMGGNSSQSSPAVSRGGGSPKTSDLSLPDVFSDIMASSVSHSSTQTAKPSADPLSDELSKIQFSDFGDEAANLHPATVVYEKSKISVKFEYSAVSRLEKTCVINAVSKNLNDVPVYAFKLELAAPKYVDLKLSAASADIIQPLGREVVTQGVTAKNQSSEGKPLLMKLRISYRLKDQAVTDLVVLKDFPQGV